MTAPTRIDQARTRVATEREAVAETAEAFASFVDRVNSVGVTPSSATPEGATAGAGTRTAGSRSTDDRCRAVRTAFAETVRPHSVADLDDSEPLLETIGSELSESIAVALAPTTETSLSRGLQRAIVSEATARRRENEVLCRALDREAERLTAAADTVDGITGWLADATEAPLVDLGFEALRERHETVLRHRDRCESLAERRQSFVRATTSGTGTGGSGSAVGITHSRLMRYLYDDFEVDHPVLATVAQVDAACAERQRALRWHLARRD
jgi:hypothetical protein